MMQLGRFSTKCFDKIFHFILIRVILCIDLIFWYIKALSFYRLIFTFGPKLLMIQNMVITKFNVKTNNTQINFILKLIELIKFLLFIIVFIFTFGVSTQALLFPNQNLDLTLLANIFYPSFLLMTGGDYIFQDQIYQAVNFSGITKQLMKLSLHESIYFN